MQVINPSDYGVDYAKAEFKTFCHAGTDSANEEFADLYDYDGLKALCIDLKDGALVFSTVLKAITDGKHYVGFGEGNGYFEIQWD